MRVAGIVLLFLMAFPAQAATTYYIDYTNGADTNNGTTKTTAWKHAPGMVGCSNNCSSYTGAGGGDTWILKGCVTIPAAALPWVPMYSAESAPVTIGVDQTWWDNTVTGCSSAWNRPILDMGGSNLSSGSIVLDVSNFGINVTGLEFKGGHFDATHGLTYLNTTPGQSTGANLNYSNLYMHGVTWSGSTDNCKLITGNSNIPNTSPLAFAHDNVLDLTDSVSGGKTACYAMFGGPPNVYNNVIKNTSNGLVLNGPLFVYSNLITNIGPDLEGGSYHGNCFESNGNFTLYFYNNICAHLASGVLGWWLAPYQGYTAYVWDSLLYDTDVSNVIDIAPPLPPTGGCPQTGSYCTYQGTYTFFNNTVECGPDSNPNVDCAAPNSGATAVAFINTHFITSYSGGSSCIVGGGNCTGTTNVVQTKTAANSQGYTISQTYAFSPTLGSNSTVGAGTNKTSTATGNLASLAYDTTYACTEVSSPYVSVSCPARTVNGRPLSGSWDSGAYEYNGGLPPTPIKAAPAPQMFVLSH